MTTSSPSERKLASPSERKLASPAEEDLCPEPAQPAWLTNWCELNNKLCLWNDTTNCWLVYTGSPSNSYHVLESVVAVHVDSTLQQFLKTLPRE